MSARVQSAERDDWVDTMVMPTKGFVDRMSAANTQERDLQRKAEAFRAERERLALQAERLVLVIVAIVVVAIWRGWL